MENREELQEVNWDDPEHTKKVTDTLKSCGLIPSKEELKEMNKRGYPINPK